MHLHAAGSSAAAGEGDGRRAASRAGAHVPAVHCLASRLDDAAMLQAHVSATPDDARAWAILGHWLYFQRRHDDAIAAWRTSAELDPSDPVVWRNLARRGVQRPGATRMLRGSTTSGRSPSRPATPRLVYELDQLAKRSGATPESASRCSARERAAVDARDDLSIEHGQLHTATGGARGTPSSSCRPAGSSRGRAARARCSRRGTRHWRSPVARLVAGTGTGRADTRARPSTRREPRRGPAPVVANCAELHLTARRRPRCDGRRPDGAAARGRSAASSTGDFQSMAPGRVLAR